MTSSRQLCSFAVATPSASYSPTAPVTSGFRTWAFATRAPDTSYGQRGVASRGACERGGGGAARGRAEVCLLCTAVYCKVSALLCSSSSSSSTLPTRTPVPSKRTAAMWRASARCSLPSRLPSTLTPRTGRPSGTQQRRAGMRRYVDACAQALTQSAAAGSVLHTTRILPPCPAAACCNAGRARRGSSGGGGPGGAEQA